MHEGARKLVEQNVDLARALAQRYLSRLPASVDADAITGAAHEGLCIAANSYDPSRNVPFRRWAVRRILGRMRDEMREQDHLSRRTRLRLDPGTSEKPNPYYDPDFIRVSPESPMSLDGAFLLMHPDGHTDDQLTLMDTILDPHAADPSENGHGTRDQVFGMMAQLPDREFRVVTMRYFGGMRRTDVARSLDISESRVGQIESMALERMRRIPEDE